MNVKRIIAFLTFLSISAGIAWILALGTSGTSAPVMAFYSWGFFLARSAGISMPLALLILPIYFLVILGVSTLMASIHWSRGLVVPIVMHCLGTVVDALTFGPLVVDETASQFLSFCLISLGIFIAYLIFDWRLAWTIFNDGSRHSTPASLPGEKERDCR
ncbi:MAG TPA: hypothetical protein P5119_03595 [Candidatus Aminicenantes bacterium]|nr:hypothetical protein [Candidatus Aminicenantes bacterium]HRY64407.1 hypothetical protein [Candidatus Aminicenantes bacterium]HRZ71320.1 hypothetical protein [Candidatus Aminicenantes bacterium]